MNRVHSRQRGMSLVEAIVAIGLFGLGLLGLNALLIGTMKTSEFASDLATARFLASHRLEQIKSSRYVDGNRDAYRNPSDICTDIDEIKVTVFPAENYGEIDLLNGTKFTYETCSSTPDIKKTGYKFVRSDYPAGAQGNLDYYNNHAQYNRFRREVYILDSRNYTNAIENVTLDGPDPTGLDSIVVDQVTPTAANPATNYVKYVLVRVKWEDSLGNTHHVTLSTEKAFYIPSF